MNQPAKPKAYPLESIVLNDELQLREGVVQSAVEEYCQVIKDGGKLPPVDCVVVDGELLLVDGFARYFAHEKALKTKILVYVLPGSTFKDAIKYACGANSKHGVPRSFDDKRKATKKAIKTWPTYSERKIAEICGVSRQLVHKFMPAKPIESTEKPESKPESTEPTTGAANASGGSGPKQGSPVESEPVYKDMDCPACLETKFVLSDGGWKCSNCNAPEPDANTPEEEQTESASFDVSKMEVDPAEWKKWLTVFGQLTRTSHKCGLYVALQTDLAALKKKAMELVE